MTAAGIRTIPSRWGLKPAEEEIAQLFHDERRMRSELAAAEQSRDIAWFGIYSFGGAAVLTAISLLIFLAMYAFGIWDFFSLEAFLMLAAMCTGNMFSVAQWRICENYVTALKVIHQLHAFAPTPRQSEDIP